MLRCNEAVSNANLSLPLLVARIGCTCIHPSAKNTREFIRNFSLNNGAALIKFPRMPLIGVPQGLQCSSQCRSTLCGLLSILVKLGSLESCMTTGIAGLIARAINLLEGSMEGRLELGDIVLQVSLSFRPLEHLVLQISHLGTKDTSVCDLFVDFTGLHPPLHNCELRLAQLKLQVTQLCLHLPSHHQLSTFILKHVTLC